MRVGDVERFFILAQSEPFGTRSDLFGFAETITYAVATNERRLPMVLLTPRAAGGGDVHTAAATMPG